MAKEYKVVTLKNGEKRYQFDVSLGYDASGNRMRTTIRTKTIKEGRQKVAEMMLKNNKVIDRDITVEKAFTLYLSDLVERNLSPVSISTKKEFYKKIQHLKDIKVNKLTEADMRIWLSGLSDKGLSDISVMNHKRHMIAFLNWCIQKKIINANPVKNVGINSNRKIEKRQMHIWTEDEFKQFIACVDIEELKEAFTIMFYCGLRKGEVFGLRQCDIDRELHELHIQQSLKHVDGEYIYTENLKTSSSNRIVPYPTWLDLSHDRDPLFQAKYYESIKYYIKKYSQKAGVKIIRAHDFRHSYAAYLISKGIDIYTVSKMLGHTSISITADVYGHLYPSARKTVQNVL